MKYGIKIDMRKKHQVSKEIQDGILVGKLWVDETEGNYTTIKNALRFNTRKEAEESITEKFEIVCNIK